MCFLFRVSVVWGNILCVINKICTLLCCSNKMFRILLLIALWVAYSCATVQLTGTALPAQCGYSCSTDADCDSSSCGQCVLVDKSANYSLCSRLVQPIKAYQMVGMSNQAGKVAALTIDMKTPANSSQWTSLEVLFNAPGPCNAGEQEWFEIRNSGNIQQLSVPGGSVFITDPTGMTAPAHFFINLFLFEISGNQTCAFDVKFRTSTTKAQVVSVDLPTGSTTTALSEQQVFVYETNYKTMYNFPYSMALNLTGTANFTITLFGPTLYPFYTTPTFLLNDTTNSVLVYPSFYPNSTRTNYAIGYVFAGMTTARANVAYAPVVTQAFFNGTFSIEPWGPSNPGVGTPLGSFPLFVVSPSPSQCVHLKGTWGECYLFSCHEPVYCGWNPLPFFSNQNVDFRFDLSASLLPNGTTVYGTAMWFTNLDTDDPDSEPLTSTGCAGTLTYTSAPCF